MPILARTSAAIGRLDGRLGEVAPALRAQASLAAMEGEALGTSAIEGEVLDPRAVRSSLARHLGIDAGGVATSDRKVEGLVEVMLDATRKADEALTPERLCAWHAALFPSGYSGLKRVAAGRWRDDRAGPMQVVSGPLGRQIVHYQAPDAERLEHDIDAFLTWANATREGDNGLLRACMAHLWFVTLHPFEDGNGRIARAVGDLFLARADGRSERCYSLSAQILREREAYYDVLEATQKGDMDITRWLAWSLGALERAVEQAQTALDGVMARERRWRALDGVELNPRERKMIGLLLDGFNSRLTTRKWAAATHCSHDTALRDIEHLLAAGVLARLPGGGRNTAYALADIPVTGAHPEPGRRHKP